jgi:hypothetical protein
MEFITYNTLISVQDNGEWLGLKERAIKKRNWHGNSNKGGYNRIYIYENARVYKWSSNK